MNHYLQPPGFLGTGASLATDLTLLAYLLLIIPGMLAGFYFARRGKHRPHHKATMITITLVNWVLIIGLMFVAYGYDIVQNIGSQSLNPRYLTPSLHALLGIPAQLLATYVVIRMIMEDRNVAAAKARGEKDTSKYWFKSAKPMMRLTIILWLLVSLGGVSSYLIRYNVISLPSLSGDVPAPAVTEEPAIEPTAMDMIEEAKPATTEEAQPATTEEAITEEEPVATEEIEPVTTEEPE